MNIYNQETVLSRWPQTTLAGARLSTWSWGPPCVAWTSATPASSPTSCSTSSGLTTPTSGQTGTNTWPLSGDLMCQGLSIATCFREAIRQEKLVQFFPKCESCPTYNLPYECNSIMHYGFREASDTLHNQVVIRSGLLPTSIKVNNHFCFEPDIFEFNDMFILKPNYSAISAR